MNDTRSQIFSKNAEIGKNSSSFAAIIPVAGYQEDFVNLLKTLEESANLGVEVIIVLDNFTHRKLTDFLDHIQKIENLNKHIVTGNYGNPGGARNAGLQQLKSEWFFFWDSDDSPKISEIVKMVQIAEKKSADLCVGLYEIQYVEQNQITSNRRQTTRTLPIEQLVREVGIWRYAFRYEKFQDLRFHEIRMAEDQLYLLEVLSRNKEIYFHDNPIYTYVVGNEKQLTKSNSAIFEIIKSIYILQEKIKSSSTSKLVLIAMARQSATYLKHSIKRRKLRNFAKVLIRIIFMKSKFHEKCVVLNEWTKIIWENVFNNSNVENTLYLAGGLGNQMFQIAYATEVCGRRNFNIDISFYESSRPAILDLLNLQEHVSKRKISKARRRILNLGIRISSKEAIRFRFFRNSVHLVYSVLFIISERFNVRLNLGRGVGYTKTFSNMYSHRPLAIIGYFQSYKTASSIKITLENRLQEIGNGLAIQYPWINAAVSPLVIHVRLGDYLTESKFGVPSADYYIHSVKSILKNAPASEIWLFSNDTAKARAYLGELFNSYSIRVIGEELDEVETLALMRLGSNFVISNSTFSFWAAFLSDSEDGIVYFPQPWFKGFENPVDLTPLTWLPSPAWLRSDND